MIATEDMKNDHPSFKTITKSRKSGVWNHFEVLEDDNSKAVCTLCFGKPISRGNKEKGPKSFGTSALWTHLEVRHRDVFLSLGKTLSASRQNMPFDASINTTLTAENTIMANIALLAGSVKRKASPPEQAKRIKIKNYGSLGSNAHHSMSDQDTAYCIGEMLILDNLPVDVVSGQGFNRLVKQIAPHMHLPTSQHFEGIIVPDIYDRIRGRISTMLESAEWIAFMIDSEINKYEEISIVISGQWISPDYEYKNATLYANYFQEALSEKLLNSIFDEIYRTWNIDHAKLHCIIADDRIEVQSILSTKVERYFKSTLNEIIQKSIFNHNEVTSLLEKCRNIVHNVQFSQSNSITPDFLSPIVVEPALGGVLGTSLINDLLMDDQSLWESTYSMMQSLLSHKSMFEAYPFEIKLETYLTHDEWSQLEDLTNILLPFIEINLELSAQTNSLSSIIPAISTLKRYLERDYDGPHVELREMIKHQYHAIMQEMNLESKTIFALSTALDPRYKLAFFSEETKQQCKNKIIKCLQVESPNQHDVNQNEQTTNIKSDVIKDIWNCYAEIISGKNSPEREENSLDCTSYNGSRELENYLSCPLLPRDDDPISWWKMNGSMFPRLTVLVKQYLSTPVHSPLKKSTEGHDILKPLEPPIHSKNASHAKNLFMQCNLPLLNFNY